jgi:hypothetical protein
MLKTSMASDCVRGVSAAGPGAGPWRAVLVSVALGLGLPWLIVVLPFRLGVEASRHEHPDPAAGLPRGAAAASDLGEGWRMFRLGDPPRRFLWHGPSGALAEWRD